MICFMEIEHLRVAEGNDKLRAYSNVKVKWNENDTLIQKEYKLWAKLEETGEREYNVTINYYRLDKIINGYEKRDFIVKITNWS